MTDQVNFPLLPPRSIEARLDHFDEPAFRADPSTVVFRLVDALCGDAGAGDLKKSTMLDRLGEQLETIYFNDLDRIFGSMGLLPRTDSESYPWNPETDMLTADQWNEVRIKDAWYRARVKDFFIAAQHGGTPAGLALVVLAGCSVSCDIYEVWRYKDNFGLTQNLGRAPTSSRNEVVITPHKKTLGNKEFRLLRQMLNRVSPEDTIVTIDVHGLGVHTPLIVKTSAADSTYFEIQKEVVGLPVLADLPAPEVLAIDLRPSENWLKPDSPETAPYAAFNITQEYGYYYLASGGARSPIDSVSYETMDANGVFTTEQNFEDFEVLEQYTNWQEYELADSPDNYPGGKFGLTPYERHPVNPDGSPYIFPFESQEDYIQKMRQQVIEQGGQADDVRYRLPIVAKSTTKKTYTPDLAVAWSPPLKDSSVTSAWVSNKSLVKEIISPKVFGASAGVYW